MKLYIKQKLFSIGDKYKVFDENENIVFYADAKIFTIGNKIHLFNQNNQEVIFISQKILSLLPCFDIFVNNDKFATVKKKFTFFKDLITIESALGEFTIDGDYFDHSYTISCNGKTFGSVQKEWIALGDVYTLDVNTNENIEFFVALVIAIDCILESKKHNN